MTHDDLVDRAGRWLRNSKRCGVVLTEFASGCIEIPDAIGWTTGGRWSYLVECKTSRGDFYADKKKMGRTGLTAGQGIGRERYYMTPPGVLSVEIVEKHRRGWGLLEVHGRKVKVLRKAIPFDSVCGMREMPILYSYVRRVHQYGIPLLEIQGLAMEEVFRRSGKAKSK